MNDASKLPVAFLWHQHQPYYEVESPDGTRMLQMPWVRFHAVKDYYDIPALLREFPALQQNFNLVPSLLVQIEDYVAGRARDTVLHLTEKSPSELTPHEREAILKQFFMANFDHLIKPHPRYYELWQKRRAASFSDQDWLDLQVWYNLCWVGESWKSSEPFKSLLEKDRFFNAEDKQALIDGHFHIMSQVIPLYRELASEGRIELSVTPFYHPILPLLCDTAIARISNTALPDLPFHFKHAEDAVAQIQTALEYTTHLFGRTPEGMWPSEGSVSSEALHLMRRAGVNWVATDEFILRHSEVSEASPSIYRPYAMPTPHGPVSMFFRDHALSDAIGFTYAKMRADEAAADFIRRLNTIRQELLDAGHSLEHHIVSVILDGENCWEFYDKNGQDFLRSLYGQLSDSRTLRTTTLRQHLTHQEGHQHPTITRLHPGSWINHNFDIWIGKHPEKNIAWQRLTEARDFLGHATDPSGTLSDSLRKAWEELYMAEGSDWFWWFGDDHQADNKMEFDDLFRYHLRRIYQLAGDEPPACLLQPIMRSRSERNFVIQPTSFIHPRIDGVVSHFYEWKDAGIYYAQDDGDTMHVSDYWFDCVYFGFDDRSLYLRVDFDPERIQRVREDPLLSLQLDFFQGERTQPSFRICPSVSAPGAGIQTVALDEILEVSIDRQALNLGPVRQVELVLSIWHGDRELVRRPSRQHLVMDIPDPLSDKYMWPA